MPRPSASGSARRGIAGRSIHNESLAGQPVIDDAADPGRGPDRRADRCRGRAADAIAPRAGSRTSATPTSPRRRWSSSTCPMPSSAATRATSELLGHAARRRPGAGRPAPPRDRPARAPEGLLPARRRRPRRPPARPRRRRLALLEDARRWVMPGPRVGRDRLVLRGLPVRLVERLPVDRRAAQERARGLPRGHLPVAAVRRHHRPARAQDQRHRDVREPARPAVRRRTSDGRRRPEVRERGWHRRQGQRRRRAVLAQLPPVGHTGVSSGCQIDPSSSSYTFTHPVAASPALSPS